MSDKIFHVIQINWLSDVIKTLPHPFFLQKQCLYWFNTQFNSLLWHFCPKVLFFLPASDSCEWLKAQSFSKDICCDLLTLVFPFLFTAFDWITMFSSSWDRILYGVYQEISRREGKTLLHKKDWYFYSIL